MGNQATSLSFVADKSTRKKFQSLGLALNNSRIRSKTYESMLRCEQTDGVDMFDHGIAVFQKYKQLYKQLTGVKSTDLPMPSWLNSELINKLEPLSVVFDYTIHHDCGKPSVLQYDETGKRHFPNHSKKSTERAQSIGLSNQVCSLIEHDMDFHTLKSEDIETFAKLPNAITLMVVGVAEVLANAEMFGGFDSVSYKIKWKHIEKRGRQVLEKIKQIQNDNNTTNE